MAGITEGAFDTIMNAIGSLVGVFTDIVAIFLAIIWDDFFVGIFLEKTATTVFLMVFAFILWGLYTKYIQAVV